MNLSELKPPENAPRLQIRRPDFSALTMPVQLCFQEVNGAWYPLKDCRRNNVEVFRVACGYAALYWRKAAPKCYRYSGDNYANLYVNSRRATPEEEALFSQCETYADLWQRAAFKEVDK